MGMSKMQKFLGAMAVAAALAVGAQTALPCFAAEEKAGASDKGGEPASLDADTVEYDMRTGIVTAEGAVLMKRGVSRVAGAKAWYNTKTQEGMVEGDVVAVREDTRVTCHKITTDGQDHMLAIGDVHGTQQDKTFTGDLVEYFPNQNDYVKIPTGGVITSQDGTFTADFMEGWLKDEHYVGVGHAHLVSPPKDFEAAGDRVDYYGKEEGKAILTGNAWAIQDNNLVRGNLLTVYLAKDSKPKVQ